MAKYLFEVENKNRLAQTGLLKRFSLNCIGKQPTLEDIRSEKAEKFKELATKRGTKEYEMWFLKYVPADGNSHSKNDTEPIQKGMVKKDKRTLPNKRKQPKTRKISFIDLLQKKQRQKTQKNSYYFYE